MTNPYESPVSLNVSSTDAGLGDLIAEFKLSIFERLSWLGCGVGLLWFGCRQSLLFYKRLEAGAEMELLVLLCMLALASFFSVFGTVQVVSSQIRVFENGLETQQYWRRKFYRWDAMDTVEVTSGFALKLKNGRNLRFYQSMNEAARTRLTAIVEKYLP